MEAGAGPAASEVADADAIIGGDNAACLLLIHQTAPENAASATTSSPADWRSIEEPQLDLTDLFSVVSAVLFTTKDTKDTKNC
jgi:hypothetical protein